VMVRAAILHPLVGRLSLPVEFLRFPSIVFISFPLLLLVVPVATEFLLLHKVTLNTFRRLRRLVQRVQ
jgi:hypothetical protein